MTFFTRIINFLNVQVLITCASCFKVTSAPMLNATDWLRVDKIIFTITLLEILQMSAFNLLPWWSNEFSNLAIVKGSSCSIKISLWIFPKSRWEFGCKLWTYNFQSLNAWIALVEGALSSHLVHKDKRFLFLLHQF